MDAVASRVHSDVDVAAVFWRSDEHGVPALEAARRKFNRFADNQADLFASIIGQYRPTAEQEQDSICKYLVKNSLNKDAKAHPYIRDVMQVER